MAKGVFFMKRSGLWSSLPNLISFARLVLSPSLLLAPSDLVLYLFLPLALSDALDGFLARLLKAQSELGKVLDPLADKVLLFTTLYVCTLRLEKMPVYLLASLFARDVFIVLGSLFLYLKKRRVKPARPLGKLTTFLVSLLVFVCLLGYQANLLVFLCLFLVYISWLDYALVGFKSLKSQTSS